MKLKHIYIITITAILTYSCIKDISIELPLADEKIVIEAMIDLDDYPIVFITKNSSYFTYVDTAILDASIIKNSDAKVIISNGDISDTLIPTILDRYPYHAYIGTKFKGEVNRTYFLKIEYDKNEYKLLPHHTLYCLIL